MDYKEINDYELLYMISDNDYSLDLLLEKYKPFVNQKLQRYNDYFYKYGIDIEDLRQEIYLSLIYAVNNFDENSDASFYTYLNVLLEHKISNFWREQFSAKNSILLNVLIPFFMNSDGIWGTFISHHCTDTDTCYNKE